MHKALTVCLFDRTIWADTLPRNSHQMARALSKYCNVIYFEAPQISLLECVKKPWRLFYFIKVLFACPVVLDPDYNIHVAKTLSVFPKHRTYQGKKWDSTLLKYFINKSLKRLKVNKPHIWVYRLYALLAIKNVNYAGLTLSITDSIESFPQNTNLQRQDLLSLEVNAMQNADAIFCTSELLVTKARQYNSNVHFLSNAVDYEFFAASHDLPKDILSIERPICGIFSVINEYKTDLKLLEQLADLKKDVSFLVIGPIEYSDNLSTIDLPTRPNIHWLGYKSYNNIAKYQSAMDILLITNKQNSNTKSSFPLRFFEHCATGKPIISVPMPSLAKYSDYYFEASDAPSFAMHIEHILVSGICEHEVAARQSIAAKNSWNVKAQQALEIIANIN